MKKKISSGHLKKDAKSFKQIKHEAKDIMSDTKSISKEVKKLTARDKEGKGKKNGKAKKLD